MRLFLKLISSLNPQNVHQSLARIQRGETENFAQKYSQHRDLTKGIANGLMTSNSTQEDCVRFVFRPTKSTRLRF